MDDDARLSFADWPAVKPRNIWGLARKASGNLHSPSWEGN